jgi:hypothetical protein
MSFRCFRGALRLPLLLSALVAVSPPVQAATYVDASSYFTRDQDFEAWYALRSGLERNFDEVCGDTFCEGDYSNLQPLRYQCSVNAANGRIGMCVWVFAGSNEEIDPATGRIRVDARAWRCRTPLASRTTIEELLAALQGDEPLRAALPGTDRSIYDGLVDCL